MSYLRTIGAFLSEGSRLWTGARATAGASAAKAVRNKASEAGKVAIEMINATKSISFTKMTHTVGRTLKKMSQREYDDFMKKFVTRLQASIKESKKRIYFIGLDKMKNPEQLVQWLIGRMRKDPVSALFIIYELVSALALNTNVETTTVAKIETISEEMAQEHGNLDDETILDGHAANSMQLVLNSGADNVYSRAPPSASAEIVREGINTFGVRHLRLIAAIGAMDPDDLNRAIKDNLNGHFRNRSR